MPEPAGLVRTADSVALRPNHVRSLALAAAVVGVVLLPIAAAEATPSQSVAVRTETSASASPQPTTTSVASAAPAVAQAVAAEFCGPARTAAAVGGEVRAQACIEQGGDAVSARIYVANGSTVPQLVALNLTRGDGSVVQVRCTIAAGDAAGRCETGPVRSVAGGVNAIGELVAVGAPLSAGVVHVESGLVAPRSQ
jgi:hypothetical protein